MADEEWERKLDERIRWNSFLPLLGTKAFEKRFGNLAGNLNQPLAQQFWKTKDESEKLPAEAVGEEAAKAEITAEKKAPETEAKEPSLSKEKETHENFIPDPGK